MQQCAHGSVLRRALPRMHPRAHAALCQRRPMRSRPCNSCPATALTAADICTPEQAVGYVLQHETLRSLLEAHDAADLHATELTGGKINFVFHVARLAPAQQGSAPTPALLLKHAPPYVKAVGPSFPLTQDRLRVEAQAMLALKPHCARYIPRVLAYDDGARVLAVEYLPPPHTKVMLGIHVERLTYPHLSDQLSDLLAASLYATSHHALEPDVFNMSVAQFANTDIKDANERVVLTEPFDDTCPVNRVIQDEALAALTAELRSDPVARAALEEMVTKYRSVKEALIHNDLHTGNLLATHDTLYCIDWEFATVGPAAFDVGCALGCLILAYITLGWADRCHDSSSSSSRPVQGAHQQPTQTSEQRVWLLLVMEEFWSKFSVKYTARVAQGGGQVNMDAFLRDAVAYAALCCIRLTIGMHSYPGYALDVAPEDLPQAQAQVLRLGRTLLHMRAQPVCCIGGFMTAVRAAA